MRLGVIVGGAALLVSAGFVNEASRAALPRDEDTSIEAQVVTRSQGDVGRVFARGEGPIPVDLAQATRGPDFTDTWFDLDRQLLHSPEGAVALTPPLEGSIGDAKHAVGGYLITLLPEVLFETTRADLIYVHRDGTHQTLVDRLSQSSTWEVETTGTRMVSWQKANGSKPSLVVVELAGGEVVAQRTTRYSTRVIGFHHGRVWVSWTSAAGRPDRRDLGPRHRHAD